MKATSLRLVLCLAVITVAYFAICLFTVPSSSVTYPFQLIEHAPISGSDTYPQSTVSSQQVGDNQDVHAQLKPALDDRCHDTHSDCSIWRDQGECVANPAFMLQACTSACGLCERPQPSASKVRLNSGFEMPSVGFGTAGLGKQTVPAVQAALAAGYTLFDTAQAPEWYREDLVGQVLLTSSIPRGNLFLTTKLHPRHHGFNSTLRQMQTSFDHLGTDYLDLVLLHYPKCWGELCGKAQPEGSWQDSWRALEQMVQAGKVRWIGVSNFDLNELSELWEMAHVKPSVVQRNSDPLSPDVLVQQYARLTGMQYQGYSTLGSQWLMKGYDHNPVLTHPAVVQAAKRAQRTPAQVVLRWALQQGQVVIPRSSKPLRIRENIDLDFVIPEADMHSINAMAQL